MWAAATNNFVDVVNALLKAGAMLEDRDKDNKTPLLIAASSNTGDVVDALLKAGAKLDSRDADGWTPLMCAAGDNSHAEVIGVLLKAGGKINERDKNGRTPLMMAAEFNTPDVLMALLNAGANPKLKSKEGCSALDYAEDNGKIAATAAYAALKKASQR